MSIVNVSFEVTSEKDLLRLIPFRERSDCSTKVLRLREEGREDFEGDDDLDASEDVTLLYSLSLSSSSTGDNNSFE